MELREFALRILESPRVETKLSGPGSDLSDDAPGPARFIAGPARPPKLAIVRAADARVPSIEGMPDPPQKARILHSFANHELQAVELFAWAIVAFPDAPRDFRAGLARILREEQMHCRLYIRRLEELGVRFGDHAVSGYFWGKMRDVRSPAAFVSAMSLTFENANLDHSIGYAAAARAAGDDETARILDRVHEDEIGHVRFGYEWLVRFKRPGQSAVDAYREHLAWPLRPALARGREFHAQGREAAGLDAEFIRLLAAADE